MITYRIMTTGEKVMLENILEALGISLEDFMEIVNLKEVLTEFKSFIETSNQRLETLEQNYTLVNNATAELRDKIQKDAFEQLFGEVEDEEK